MKCKNKEIAVNGFVYNIVTQTLMPLKLRCICTNDEKGKSLSIGSGGIQFTIPFEAVEHCFKGDYRK